MLCGLGLGMILSTGSSTGGTDIIGIIINKKIDKVSVGNVGFMFNIIVYFITGLNYGIETMIYSIIFSAFDTMTLDKNHTQNIKSETIIFTKNDPNEMIHFINYVYSAFHLYLLQ